ERSPARSLPARRSHARPPRPAMLRARTPPRVHVTARVGGARGGDPEARGRDGEDGGVTSSENGPRLRSALFVDFDNVYIGLRRLDPEAAEAFATSPGTWLSALESGNDIDGDFSRRFLVRSCYLNPARFAGFRPNFTRAGFSVVDCPSLTQQGKSSADINLVLDAVDALAAQTRYDEFVIVSADADFTPLALRCRADDRRVTIVTASPAASAY